MEMVRSRFPWALLKRQPTVGDVALQATWLPREADVGRCVFLDKGQTSPEEKQQAYDSTTRRERQGDIWSFSSSLSKVAGRRPPFFGKVKSQKPLGKARRRRGKRQRKGVLA